MAAPLEVYRDDGPLGRAWSMVAGRVAAPAPLLMVLAVVALAAGVALDGRATGVPTVGGWLVFVLLGAVTARRAPHGRFKWVTPPLVRAAEYSFIAVLGWRAGGAALAVTYGLLAAIAFRHYDLVYRLRHQGVAPPSWVSRIGLGWEGRTGVLLAATLAGLYLPVALALAVVFAAVFGSESVASWVGLARSNDKQAAMAAEDDEDVGA